MSNTALEKLKRAGEIESLLPDNDRYTNRFNIKSESSNRLYVVAQNKANGQWSCSCMSWITRRYCKHLTTLQPMLAEVEFKTVKQISAPAQTSSSQKQNKKSSRKTETEKVEKVDLEFDNEDPFADKTEKWAKLLNGREYGDEINKKEEAQAKKDGVVIVFGYSDDNMEFRGAIHEEIGCYDGGEFLIDAKGVLPERENIDDDDELRDYFSRDKKAKKIEAVWEDKKADWTYKTSIPHKKFKVMEDGNLYCIGIVFDINDLK